MQVLAARSRIRPWFVRNAAGALLVAAMTMALGGCARSHRAYEEMSWFDAGSGVCRLVFESAPSHHILIPNAQEFLDRLRQHGKRIVRGEFDVYCDWHGNMVYFTDLNVDGIPIPMRDSGSYGTEGNHLEIGPFAGVCQ